MITQQTKIDGTAVTIVATAVHDVAVKCIIPRRMAKTQGDIFGDATVGHVAWGCGWHWYDTLGQAHVGGSSVSASTRAILQHDYFVVGARIFVVTIRYGETTVIATTRPIAHFLGEQLLMYAQVQRVWISVVAERLVIGHVTTDTTIKLASTGASDTARCKHWIQRWRRVGMVGEQRKRQ
jgi:hypothetical protein